MVLGRDGCLRSVVGRAAGELPETVLPPALPHVSTRVATGMVMHMQALVLYSTTEVRNVHFSGV